MKVLDLFSGIGGFSLGLERAGMETVAFCEFDDHARKILNKNWPGIHIYKDVRKLNAEKYRKTVDIVTGGFPCQPHSLSGKRLASEDERDLWGETFRVFSEVKPRWGIFENVRGLLSSESGRYFGRILNDLASIGYVVEWFIMPASAVGAPHRRERVWIVAYPDQTQFKRICLSERIQKEYTNTSYPCWGKDKPGLVRTLDGVPNWMDRLARLGNAVVPQIPELIGRAIMQAELDFNL